LSSPLQQHLRLRLRCDLKGAQARRVIERFEEVESSARPQPVQLDENCADPRAPSSGVPIESAPTHLIEDCPFLRPEALGVAFRGRACKLRRKPAAAADSRMPAASSLPGNFSLFQGIGTEYVKAQHHVRLGKTLAMPENSRAIQLDGGHICAGAK